MTKCETDVLTEKWLPVQALLHQQIRQRILGAWRQVYATQVAKHFQNARANGLHRAHVMLRVLACWQVALQQQQRKAAAVTAAESWRRYVLCSMCCELVTAWQ